MVPDPSHPGVNGYFGYIAYLPLINRISEGFKAAASTLTST